MTWWKERAATRPHRLIVDAGGLMVPNPSALTEREGEAVARADVFGTVMAQMGYAAQHVGVHELALGLAELRKWSAKHRIPLLSTNVYTTDGKPAFQRTLSRKVGMLQVCMLGLMSDSPPDLGRNVLDQGLAVREPAAEAKAAVRELEGQGCELIVLLSQLRRQEIEKVVAAAPGIDLVLGSTDMDLTMQLTTMGKGLYADAFTKGKYVGEVVASIGERKDQFVAANLRASLQSERVNLAQQVQSFQAQLETANTPGGPLQLNAETRQVMERQLAAARARLQRVTMDLEGVFESPKGASTLDLVMTALGTDVKDDPAVDKVVQKLKEKYPKAPGAH